MPSWMIKALEPMPFEDLLPQFPILETERLLLRELLPSDREDLFALFSDPEVTRYNDVDTFASIREADDIIDFMRGRWEKRAGIRWAITLKDGDDSLIGTCGFNTWGGRCHCASIGYDLMRRYWGLGLMPEAVRAMLDFGFNTLRMNRIEADVTVGNIASGRVLRKCGFTFEGVLRERGYWKNTFHDLEFYSLLRREFS